MSRTLLDKWRLLQAALTAPDLSKGAATTLGRLLWYLNLKEDREHRCFPSYETLAQDLGCSRRQIMRNVEELERHGWLTADRRNHGETRAFASNSFRFAFDRAPSPEVVTPTSLGGDAHVTRVVTPVSSGVVTPMSPYKGKIEEGDNNSPAREAGVSLQSADEGKRSSSGKSEHDNPREARKPPTDGGVESALAGLKANYPKRPGAKWPNARKKLPAILRAGVSVDLLVRKAGEYRDQCEGDKVAPRYVLQPDTWLNQESWTIDYAPVAKTPSDPQAAAYTDAQWTEFVGEFDRGGSWPQALGPPPGCSGCRVPPEILRTQSSAKVAA